MPAPPPSSRKARPDDEDQQLSEADMAQAFRELAKGEQTATMLEAQLSRLESKIDDLLADVDGDADADSEKKESDTVVRSSSSAREERTGGGDNEEQKERVNGIDKGGKSKGN
ncbi:MAG: hypothetical protein M1817_003634 [Caeruleum heppii]|nr:MAG: hypothetical protein M1817_003634 [Caeruleum heppii]